MIDRPLWIIDISADLTPAMNSIVAAVDILAADGACHQAEAGRKTEAVSVAASLPDQITEETSLTTPEW